MLKMKSNEEKIRKEVLSLAAIRNSCLQNQRGDCYELEKKICVLTAKYVLIKLSKVFWLSTILCGVPAILFSIASKFKK